MAKTTNRRYLGTDPKTGAYLTRADTITEEQEALLEAARAGDWTAFDTVVVAFSGGKDSLACLLWCLDHGCPAEKLELWHHEVDGRETAQLMDWPVTVAYCRAVAKHFRIPLYCSWKQGGFEGEMVRREARTQPTRFERPTADGIAVESVSGHPRKDGKDLQTRMRFPAIARDLQTRWCSAYLKIDVAKRVFNNDPRFSGGRFLLITGERREEGTTSKAGRRTGRATYAEATQHPSTNKKREVVQWRPVIDETEQAVWDRIAAHQVEVHPAYRLGFGRVSCAFCIFGDADQFRTAAEVLPSQFERVAQLEGRFQTYWAAQPTKFGGTLKGRSTLRVLVKEGTSYRSARAESVRRQAASTEWSSPVVVSDWQLPAGAFRKCGGPL